MNQNVEKEFVRIIMNQTNYDENLAKQKLKEWDNNFANVIKEYLNPNFKKKEDENSNLTTNQKVFSSIRKFMDKASYNYERKKQYKEYLSKQKKIQEQIDKETKMEKEAYDKKIKKNELEEKEKLKNKLEKDKQNMIKENKLDGIEIKESLKSTINDVN